MSLEYKKGKKETAGGLSTIRIGIDSIWQVAASSQKECWDSKPFLTLLCSTQKGLFSDTVIP
jgi:hypothetical protein